MSHIWNKNSDGTWKDYALGTDAVQLAQDGPGPLPQQEQRDAAPRPALFPSHDPRGEEQWVLLCQAANPVQVNGRPVVVGARVLADRDGIAPGTGSTLWFCAERRAEIVEYVGEPANCIRCKLPLERGTPAVRCPAAGCGFWHHESSESPCWTYAEGCAACGHPTDLNAGYQWSPEEL